MIRITPGQIKKVWARAREIGMSEYRLREIVERISGRPSIKELTKRQSKKVIDILEGKAVLPAPRDSNVIAFATPGQLSLIEELKIQAGWSDDHLMNFIKRYKRDNLRKLRRSEAGIVIHVLNKAIKKKEIT